MEPAPTPDVAAIGLALALDLAAILALSVGLYFRRHARPDLTVVFTFFNLCLFVAITVIQTTEVAAALGFGLFAILSIIRLRSEPFDNRELGYFFGALVLGLLNGIGTDSWALTVALNALIVGTMAVLDHRRVLRAGERRHVVLDVVVTEPEALRATLEARLGAPVTTARVSSVDYLRDAMDVEVQLAPRPVAPLPLVPRSPVAAGARR